MSWLQPSEYEQQLLNEISIINPEVVQLAQLASLARKVEPLLLRNLRMRFLPFTETELEAQLWFSPLVSAHSTHNFVLHHGVARLLAEGLSVSGQCSTSENPINGGITLEQLWEFTQEHTQHWSPLDRLEQQLRFHVLQNHKEKVQQGIRDVLRKIMQTQDEEQRIELARWAKKTLSVIADSCGNIEETTWLAQFAANTLGAISEWTNLVGTNTPPNWLTAILSSPFEPSKIGVQVYFDPQEHYQVLKFSSIVKLQDSSDNSLRTTPASIDLGNMSDHKIGLELLPLPMPPPARVHISCGETNRWHIVGDGICIKLQGLNRRIILTTTDGKQFELISEFVDIYSNFRQRTINPPKLYLTFIRADGVQAEFIAGWLLRRGISVELVQEIPEKTYINVRDGRVILLRLWSQAAQRHWETTYIPSEQSFVNNLILRTERAALPIGVNPSQIIELSNWNGNEESAQSRQLLAAIHDRLAGKPPEIENSVKSGNNDAYSSEATLSTEFRRIESKAYSSEIQVLLDELKDIATSPTRRLQIGDQLAELGDPRPGIGLDVNGLPDIDWVEIPAGEFIYGEDETQQTLHCDVFYISRYPVTNMHYQAFIEAGGYRNERWWKDLYKPKPEQSYWQQPNRPKENIDWYEAVAFTRWLSEQCSYEISLPTEQQWEKAARGMDGRQYPWGDRQYRWGEFLSGYANVDEKNSKSGSWYLEETTAVGMYPHGASPFGVLDMSGNVWEWCLNKYDKPEQTQADTTGVSRVSRGGSWNHDPVYARPARRYGLFPHARRFFRGFRVFCMFPTSSN